MVQTRRMNSDKSVKLKSENITLKKKNKKKQSTFKQISEAEKWQNHKEK